MDFAWMGWTQPTAIFFAVIAGLIVIEQWVRRAPGQYLWIHRRFKGAGLDYPARA